MFSRALYRSLIHVYLVYIHCTAPYIINNKAISKNTSKPKSRFPTALCTKKKEKKKRYHDHKATKTRIIQREKKKKELSYTKRERVFYPKLSTKDFSLELSLVAMKYVPPTSVQLTLFDQ